MQVDEVLSQARDAMTVRRVFGDPIERDGVTVIPVANIMGGGGGGGGEGPATPGGEAEAGADVRPSVASGSGAGFALRATPAGAYVIRGIEVDWEPAIDRTRVLVMGQLIGLACLFVTWRLIRAWIRR
jgi:uncharacterized spore protein YtfJ